MKKARILMVTIFISVVLLVTSSYGLDQIVEKKTFSLRELTLVSGKKIAPAAMASASKN